MDERDRLGGGSGTNGRERVPFAPLWACLRQWLGRPLGVVYLASWRLAHGTRLSRFLRLPRRRRGTDDVDDD
jgi:hypothetical protein